MREYKLNRKASTAFPSAYYDLFDEMQADMQKWEKDGSISGEDSFGMHVEWNPRLLHADRDLYKESGAAYRRRLQNHQLT